MLGRLLLTLSYFGWGVGVFRFDRHRKCRGANLVPLVSFVALFFLECSLQHVIKRWSLLTSKISETGAP